MIRELFQDILIDAVEALFPILFSDTHLIPVKISFIFFS